MRKKVVLMMIVAAALMALPATAQTFKTQHTEQPTAVFQSTSTMTASGSALSANPTLNADGTASYNGASSAPSGPRRAKMADDDNDGYDDDTWLPVTPGNSGTSQPLGDAVLPLLLMAFAFCGYLYLRRKRSAAYKG